MKKTFLFIITGIMLACLTGCGPQMPAAAADGTPWSEDWLTLERMLGVEEPGHGLTLQDNKAAKGMHYSAWSTGEARPYVNASGEEKSLYDGQMTLLMVLSDTAEEARLSVDEWIDLARDSYTVADTSQQTCNGQEFTVLTYTFPSDSSLFTHGVSAFTTFDTWAISVEFACQDTFEENAWEVVEDFLNHCHYAAK